MAFFGRAGTCGGIYVYEDPLLRVVKRVVKRAAVAAGRRLPPLFAAEHAATLPEANALLAKLRLHHNQKELHRELLSGSGSPVLQRISAPEPGAHLPALAA